MMWARQHPCLSFSDSETSQLEGLLLLRLCAAAAAAVTGHPRVAASLWW